MTAARSQGCGGVLDYPSFNASTADLAASLGVAGELGCAAVAGPLLSALDTDLCSQAFEGAFFQMTIVYLIAGLLFLIALLSSLIGPYFDLEKEEAAAAVSRASFGSPSRAASGRKDGRAEHTRSGSVRSNGHSPASRQGSIRDQQALLTPGRGGSFLVHDFHEFVLPDGKVVMRPVLRTEDTPPTRKESIRQQESLRRKQESQRRESSQRVEGFPRLPSVRQQDDFVSAAYRPAPGYGESLPSPPSSDRYPGHREPYREPNSESYRDHQHREQSYRAQYREPYREPYTQQPQSYEERTWLPPPQREAAAFIRGSGDHQNRDYLPSPTSNYRYSGDASRQSQPRRSAEYHSASDDPWAPRSSAQTGDRVSRRSHRLKDDDERSQGSGEGEAQPQIIKSSGLPVDLSTNPPLAPPSSAPGPLFYSAAEVNTVMQAQLDAIYKIYGTALFYPSVDPEDSYSEADVPSLNCPILHA